MLFSDNRSINRSIAETAGALSIGNAALLFSPILGAIGDARGTKVLVTIGFFFVILGITVNAVYVDYISTSQLRFTSFYCYYSSCCWRLYICCWFECFKHRWAGSCR